MDISLGVVSPGTAETTHGSRCRNQKILACNWRPACLAEIGLVLFGCAPRSLEAALLLATFNLFLISF